MTTINVPLLERTMNLIESDQACFSNRLWGVTLPDGQTIANFAGWATILSDPRHRPPRGRMDPNDASWVHEWHWTVEGVWMPTYAAGVLGLNASQREAMFHADWDVCALRAGVTALVRSNGEIDGDQMGAVMQAVHPAQISVD